MIPQESHHDPDPPESTEKVKAHLIRLVCELMSAINSRSLDSDLEIKNAAHPDFTAEYAYHSSTFSFPEHLDHYRQLLAKSPDFHIKTLSVSADVDDYRGRAFVFLHGEASGNPPGVITEGMKTAGMNVFEWWREGDRWLCYKATVLKGLDVVS